MRKLSSLLLLLVALYGNSALAQTNSITVPCDACRHPIAHPEDYVNHAFNQIYGPDAWMDFDQADEFFIRSPEGLLVHVDADFLFLGIGIEGFRLPLWPTNMVQFTLALPNGTVIVFIRSKFLVSLPVPANRHDPTPDDNNSGATGSDGSGSEGDDEGEEWDGVEEDPEEPEIDDDYEYVGYTDIEDPDENGEFPDPDWCEEC